MSQINFLPTLPDLLAGVVAAAASGLNLTSGSPSGEFMEQVGAQVVGKIGAKYFAITDPVQEETLGLTEHDMYVGFTRGAYSSSQKRVGNRALMDGFKGLLFSALGQQVNDNLVKNQKDGASA
jgi:hypothetical protein